jgi:hypothetical protein
VLNDGVAFIAMNHTHVEKTGVFPVEHFAEPIMFPLAVILWRLNEPDLRIGKMGYHSAQPVWCDNIVAVQYGNKLSVWSSFTQGEI